MTLRALWLFVRAYWVQILVGLVVVMALATAGVERTRRQAAQLEVKRLELAIEKQKTEAANKLTTETNRVRDLEAQLAAGVAAQNEKDADHEKTAADYERRLVALGRLRDPRAGSGGGGGCTGAPNLATTDSRGADTGEAPGLLSMQTSDDLRAALREADTINNAYSSCRADAIDLRRQLEAWRKSVAVPQ